MNRVRLGDIAKFQNGKAFKPEQWHDEGLPIIRIQNLNDPEKDYNYHSEEIEPRYHVFDGDILIAWSASLGVYEWDRGDAYLNQHIFKTIFKTDYVDKDYFKYMLGLKIEQVEEHLRGSTMKHINKGDFEDLKIPLPPLQTQKKIAAVLDKADSLRQKRRQTIEKLDELIPAVFQDQFVNTSKEFKKVNLKDICEKITDGTHQSPNYISEGIPFLFVSNIKNDVIDFNTDKYISEKEYQELYKRTPIKVGDILLSTVGSYGNPVIVKTKQKFMFQRHIAYLKPIHEKVDYVYLYGAIKSSFVQQQIEREVRGVAQKTLNLTQLKDIEIFLPPIDLQKKFSSTIRKIEGLKNIKLNSLSELDDLFNSLLQKAFNGELNFSNTEEQLLAAEEAAEYSA